MTSSNSISLTKYPLASFRELLTLSVPLMLASLSGLLMNFCDRVVLAYYSTEAMNAAVTAGIVAQVFSYGALSIALIAEVFVGKKNGAGLFLEAAKPVWQMIWFSLATTIIFLPCAIFFTPFLVPSAQFDGQAAGYFTIWMLFGPAFPLAGALSAFFIGTGRVKIVTIATIGSNVLNICLNILLVFGIKDFLPPLGAHGSALATGISQIVQVLILAWVFLSEENRRRYNTTDYAFDKTCFVDCLKIGSPNAIGHMIELSAWALILRLMANQGDTYITVFAIGQNLGILFAFFSQGLQKGVIAVAANLIGQNKVYLMNRLMTSGFKILATGSLLLLFPLVLYPDPIVKIFLQKELNSAELFAIARQTGIWIWIFIIFDTSVWIMAGILTAFSDTKFIMVTNALAAWGLAVIPTYIAINIFHISPYYAFAMMNIYALLNMMCFMARVGYVRKREQNLAALV